MTITEEAIRFIWGQVDKLFVRKNDVQQEVNSSTNPVSSAAVKAIVDRLSGTPIVPKGSIEFSNLPTLTDASIGDLYNIKDNFTTTDDFIEGAGAKISAGTNVVCVEENLTKKWDCFGTNFEVDNEPVQNSNNPISSNAVYNLKQVVDGLSGGTAKTAEKLATARNIAATPFDGTADIDISYNNLIDKPTIPTVSNDLTNELKAKYDAAETNSHTHSNKEILDGTTAAFTTELKEKVEIPYLPKAGGTMTGNIDTAINKTEIIVNADKSKVENLTVAASGTIEASEQMTANLPNKKSFVGTYHDTTNDAWYNIVSIRHRNGYNDGNKSGMAIYSDMFETGKLKWNDNLKWNKQNADGTWQAARTLLDTVNYSNQMAVELTSENLNNEATNGICGLFYAAANNTCQNTAVPGDAFLLIAIRIAANLKMQVAFYPHNNKMYMRSWDGKIWTTWDDTAATLKDSGWIDMEINSDFVTSGTIKYRTYGKQLMIYGENVVLAQELKISPSAPQMLASTTGIDFSKIKCCSGFGRTAGGKGAHIHALQYLDGTNMISAEAVAAACPAGENLYFTITGLID